MIQLLHRRIFSFFDLMEIFSFFHKMGKNTTEISYKSLELLMQEMIKRFSLSKKGVDVNFLEG